MKRFENVTATALAHVRVAVVSSVIVFSGSYAYAQLSKVPLAQRVQYSDLIVEGKVTGKRSFWGRDHAMIYTASTVEIFKIFKGNVSASSIEILTEGGVVGESMIKVEPSLQLKVGDIGIFTCEHVKRFKLGSQKSTLPQYEAYASVQGFIQYDLHTRTARDVFSKYNDIENELYKRFLPKGTASYRTIKNFDFHVNNGTSILVTGFSSSTLTAGTSSAAPVFANTITGFSPTTVSAGTGTAITITGTGFGATQGSGFVRFRNANDGGATVSITPLSTQYVSWSNTEIVVQVPQDAATGTFEVVQGTTATSPSALTVTYNHLNVNFDPGPGTLAYQPDHINDNGSGGYTLRMHTGFDANASAKASFMRALDTWRCNSNVNWTIGATTSVHDAVSDGTNIITFDDAAPLSAGVLGVGYSYWSGCASGPNIVWFVNEIDLILDDGSNINPLTWEYGPAAPTISEYDFESVCVKELGRLHQLGHVTDPSSVMFYALTNGTNRRTLSANDLAGANFVQAKSIIANICGPGAMTTYICNTLGPTDIALSNASVNENIAVNTAVGTLSSTDPDLANTFTYSLVAGTGDADNASFNINGNELRFSISPDFDTKSSYTARIRSTDQGGLPYEEAFSITITNLNETPTDLSLSASTVNENVSANTVVGTLSTTDPDAANTFTYTLVSGTGDTDNSSFNISGAGLRITGSPDFETKSSYSVRVRTTDQGSLPFEKTFAITISNVNETPADLALSASSISENVATNTVVGTLSTTDPDAANTFTYTLVTGTGDGDNSSFNISGSGLRITNSPDFETKNSYNVRIRTTDQGSLPYEEAFIITITNVNETPTDLVLSASSINENVVANTVVGTLSTTDPDAANTFTYTLAAGSGDGDNSSFNISGAGLRITNSPDFETKSSYSVRIRTTDQGSLPYEEVFTITINNANEAPTDLALSASSINENVAPNTVVGTLSATDADVANTFTYTLVAGTGDGDNASFNISGAGLRVTNSPDFETKSSYSVRIRTTDQGSLPYEEVFTITINNANEAPTDLALSASSINENVAPNTVVGTLSATDADVANTFTYTLVAGTGDGDNGSFNISGAGLRITNSPDFETKSSYSVRIRTTDQGSLPYEEIFTITINNVNETPTDIALSAFSVNENVAANSTVGTLSTTDPDAANTFTYTLVAGTGDGDNSSFNIDGADLRIASSPDFEIKNSYSVRVRTTDQGSLLYEETFAITINNGNEIPTDITLSATSVNENVAGNSTVGTLTTIDPDAGNTFTYTLVAGSGDGDNSSFNISGMSLRIANSPDFEIKSSYNVRIRTIDQGGLSYEDAFTIATNNLNEAPTDLSLSASTVNEAVAPNAVVGVLSTTDADAANTFTYLLVAGAGDADNASFNINGGDLRISVSPNFATKSSYAARVRSTDQGGLFYEEAFTINVTNVNDAPTDISLSATTVDENVAINTVVGTLSSTDQDTGSTFVYSLVAGAGDEDNASFNINGSDLRISVSPNFATKSSYLVRVRTTDQGGLFYEEAFSINITNVNDAPTDIGLSATTVDENVVINTVVGTLSSTDPDAGSTFIYSLAPGAGSEDNAAFNINGSDLRISVSPDFETQSSYTVRISSTGPDGLSYEEAFIIVINDVLENIEINNYMSPNGDGKNDNWEIRGNLSFSECDVKILNRFGNTVYKSKGYDNTWDGTLNGDDLPAGVYYYVISCGGKDPVTGDITLIR